MSPFDPRGLWRALRERPVLANSGALIALRATNLIARMVLTFVIAHRIAPASFGLFVYAVSIAEIAKVVADFGMDTLAIREYAAAASAPSRFASSLAGAKAVFGVLVYGGLVAFFAWRGPGAQAVLGFVVGTTVLTSLLTNFSLDWFQARLRVARALPRVLATNVVLTLIAVAVVSRVSDLRVQAIWFPAIEAATGLVLLGSLAREGLLARPWLAPGEAGTLARRSLAIAVTAIVIMTYTRLDVLVLSHVLDPAALGEYGIAFRFTEPFQIAAAAVGLSVFSRFSALFAAGDADALRRTTARYALATLGYGAVSALGLLAVAPPVIERWFPSYVPAVPILRVLAVALVFRSLNATLAGILQGAGRFATLTAIAGWNLALVFALLWWLVPRRGAPGAALALLLAEAINTTIQFTLVTAIVRGRARSVAHAG